MKVVEYHNIGGMIFMRIFRDSFPLNTIERIDWGDEESDVLCVEVKTKTKTYLYYAKQAEQLRAALLDLTD